MEIIAALIVGVVILIGLSMLDEEQERRHRELLVALALDPPEEESDAINPDPL